MTAGTAPALPLLYNEVAVAGTAREDRRKSSCKLRVPCLSGAGRERPGDVWETWRPVHMRDNCGPVAHIAHGAARRTPAAPGVVEHRGCGHAYGFQGKVLLSRSRFAICSPPTEMGRSIEIRRNEEKRANGREITSAMKRTLYN